jgi:hypothetical protein
MQESTAVKRSIMYKLLKEFSVSSGCFGSLLKEDKHIYFLPCSEKLSCGKNIYLTAFNLLILQLF